MDTKIVETLKKLLSLAKGNTTEAEAASAMAKINELLIQHNLSMKDLEISQRPVSETGRVDFADTGARWRMYLWWAAAELNLCTYLRLTNGRATTGHIVVGTPERIQVTAMTAEYLIATVRRISRAAEKEAGDNAGKFFRKEFRLGCSQRVVTRALAIIEQRSKATWTASTGETLPAILDMVSAAKADAAAFCEKKMNVRKAKAKPKPKKIANYGAYVLGHIAGDKISLDKQIGQNTTKGLLS